MRARYIMCAAALALLGISPAAAKQEPLNVYGNQAVLRPGPSGTLMIEYDTNQDQKGDTLFIYLPVGSDEKSGAIKLELMGRYNDLNGDGKYSLDELTKREFEKQAVPEGTQAQYIKQ